jgi:hypothetical protein
MTRHDPAIAPGLFIARIFMTITERAERLAAQILADRNKPETKRRSLSCAMCGRACSNRFCSTRCETYHADGFAAADPTFAARCIDLPDVDNRIPMRSWELGGESYYGPILDRFYRLKEARLRNGRELKAAA